MRRTWASAPGTVPAGRARPRGCGRTCHRHRRPGRVLRRHDRGDLPARHALIASVVGGLGVGAAGLVAVTMLASLTLLPPRARLRGLPHRQARAPRHRPGQGPPHHRRLPLGPPVARQPRAFAAVGLVTLIALAVPVLSIRLGSSDESNSATTHTTRRAYDLKAAGFGAGASGPLVLTADIGGARNRPVLDQLVAAMDAPVVRLGDTERSRLPRWSCAVRQLYG